MTHVLIDVNLLRCCHNTQLPLCWLLLVCNVCGSVDVCTSPRCYLWVRYRPPQMRLSKKRCAYLSAGLYSIPTHIGCFGRVGLFLLHVSVCKLAFGQPTGNLYERLIILSAVAAPCLHPMVDPTISVSVFFSMHRLAMVRGALSMQSCTRWLPLSATCRILPVSSRLFRYARCLLQ